MISNEGEARFCESDDTTDLDENLDVKSALWYRRRTEGGRDSCVSKRKTRQSLTTSLLLLMTKS